MQKSGFQSRAGLNVLGLTLYYLLRGSFIEDLFNIDSLSEEFNLQKI